MHCTLNVYSGCRMVDEMFHIVAVSHLAFMKLEQ